MSATLVWLVHWNEAECRQRSRLLEELGYRVECRLAAGPQLLRDLRAAQPAAVIIDLSRLPSQGRDLGISIRHQKASRFIPLVFVGGEQDKVAALRSLLPDAAYARWEQMDTALEAALRQPPKDPVVPESVFAAYAGRPLADRLGIRPGMVLGLAGAPAEFVSLIGKPAKEITIQTIVDEECDLIVWFPRSQSELQRDIQKMASLIQKNSLWIGWPKQAARMQTDLTQVVVRQAGLAAGLVDYKICSIDETWSGLKFTRRKGSDQ